LTEKKLFRDERTSLSDDGKNIYKIDIRGNYKNLRQTFMISELSKKIIFAKKNSKFCEIRDSLFEQASTLYRGECEYIRLRVKNMSLTLFRSILVILHYLNLYVLTLLISICNNLEI